MIFNTPFPPLFILMILALIAGLSILVVLLVIKNMPSQDEQPKNTNGTDAESKARPRFCSYCGSSYESYQAVCLNCGATVQSQTISGISNRRLAAGLLGIFLGVFGIHNFYLGNTQKAVIQLLLGTVGILFIFGPMISSIWGLVEGILILTGNMPVDEA